jgi:hypothetical protein
MYSKILIAVLSSLFLSSAYASDMMRVEGKIKNGLSRDIHLQYQSWDIGDADQQSLVVSAGGQVGFDFLADARQDTINFALSGGSGSDKVACLYEIKYGPHTFVRGAVTLTGPNVWTEAQSAGRKPATCLIRVDDWDYKNSMKLRYVMK